MLFSPQFITYYREYFFGGNEEEFQKFLTSLEAPLPRTIRIKPGKIGEVKARLESDGWVLHPTLIDHVFSLDRASSFDPLERRIGFSVDHLIGNFYIQELAAGTTVNILAEGKVHHGNLNILDLCASPGGKTTQLAEHFPESFIVANEPSRERIPQLLQNLDRMGSANIGVTLYPGQYFIHFPEQFDRVLLDAPCSGEGTLFKGTESTKYWNKKNILAIAHLQKKLIRSGFVALKTGGEMIYSTCSMNHWENEEVVNSLQEQYPESIEILFQKRFMPHIDHTGGFFITKMRKTHPVENIRSERKKDEKVNPDIHQFRGKIDPWILKEGYRLYAYREKILVLREDFDPEIIHTYYFMRFGEVVGEMRNGKFIPTPWSYRYMNMENTPRCIIPSEEALDEYLRGGLLRNEGIDEWVLMLYRGAPLALEYRKDNILSNTFPKEWRRR